MLHRLNSAETLIQRTTMWRLLRDDMYYIGLDVHKKTISYCVKDAAGHVQQEGKIGSTRRELDAWIGSLPQPRTIAMEATIFSGWIYDHSLPYAVAIKAAHPLRDAPAPRGALAGSNRGPALVFAHWVQDRT